MSDNKNIRGPQDANRINVNEDYEVQYWTEKFGISSEELREAVMKAGTSVADVEQYLNKNK